MSAHDRAAPYRTKSPAPEAGAESGSHLRRTPPKGPPSSGLVALSHADDVELPFEIGEIVAGKYQIVGLLGSGGMGYVVSALHVELGELVALKFLRHEALEHEQLVARFAREARAAAKIRSEHVVRVFDVGTLPDGVPFIVMEHLDGEDLADVVHKQGPLPIPVAVEYVMQACEALASAHAKGIVHRDVKPENLFRTRAAHGLDVIKVLDFGISKLALTASMNTGSRQFVKTQIAMGSPTYMSPEQLRACSDVDSRADVWSLGCVLFELLTGTTVFDAPTLMQLGAAILESDPVRLRSLIEAPLELESVILRCLRKDPAERFQNVADLAAALAPFAPRRAKVFAERCRALLSEGPESSPRVELVSLASLPPADFATLPPPEPTRSTSSPTTASLVDIPFLRKRPLAKKLIPLAAGVALVGLYWALRAPSADPAEARPAVALAAPQPKPVAEAPAAPAPAAAPSAAPAAEPVRKAPRSAQSARSVAPATAKPRAVAPKPKPPARARTAASSRIAEEPDVGF